MKSIIAYDFRKPETSLADPWPAPTILPKITQIDNTGVSIFSSTDRRAFVLRMISGL